jgi:hypothetical protein
MTALREIAAVFDIEWNGSALEKGFVQLNNVKAGLDILGGVLRTGASIIREFTLGYEESAGQLEDTANALGLTTTQLQEMDVAATRAGLNVNAFRGSLQRFAENVTSAAAGSGAAAEVFSQLHIQLKDAAGGTRNTSDVMDDLAVAFDKVEDPAKRTHLATELFGRSGARLATILHTGSGGLAELRKELEGLGGGLTKDGVEAAGKFGDELDRLKVSFDSTRSSIAVVLLPPLTFLVEKVRAGIVWFTQLARTSSIVQAGLAAIGIAAAVAGGSMLAAFAPVIAAMAPWVLGIAAVVLILDDLITLFRGGQSVIGDFIDKMFGVGASKQFVEDVKLAFDAVTLAIADAREEVEKFFQLFGSSRQVDRNAFRSVDDAAASGFATTRGRVGDRPAERRSVEGAIQQGSAETTHSLQTLLQTARRSGQQITPELRAQLAAVALPTLPRPQGGGPGGVQQTNQTTIQVNGARDPAAVAREVVRLTEQRQSDALARAHAARRDHTEGT